MAQTAPGSVKETGALAGAILEGMDGHNAGLRLRVLHDQEVGRGGRIQGPFVVLAAGTSDYAALLASWEGQAVEDASRLIDVLAGQTNASRVHLLNCNSLRVVE